MRNREGRHASALIRQGTARRTLPVALACGTALAAGLAAAGQGTTAPGRWVVRALAADSGCVVLDDGRSQHLRCMGERLGPNGPRLLRVEATVALFEVDTGLPYPLVVRVDAGASIDAHALRGRLHEATGPRPGWIGAAAATARTAPEGERP